MSCVSPIQAFRAPSGEVVIGGDWRGTGRWMELPCSRCIGCKLDRARAWSIRIKHEAQLFDSNLFLTLTYSEACLPSSLSLEYPDFSGFMKRLRKRCVGVSIGPDGGRPIRFFVAGEYGGVTGRPHWHAILFNMRFKDQSRLFNGDYRSTLVEDLWDRGDVRIGEVSTARAAYVAGYTLKKAREAVYLDSVVDRRTGELSDRRPPFVVMSRRPGIGAWWYRRFAGDVFPADHAVQDGSRFKPPRYYLDKFKIEGDAGVVEEIMERRYARAAERREDSSPERRLVRKEFLERKTEFFSERNL